MSAAPPTAAPGFARAVTLVAFCALFAYFNSLHGAFVFDDNVFLADPNLSRPWKSALWTRPVIGWSLAANYWLDGTNPRGYHLANLAAHVAAALLLADLVRRVLLRPRFAGRYDATAGWVGLAAGLVWLVHPLNTQSVTYVVQRCESWMGLFYLGAVWCFLRAADGSRWWYAAAALSAALSAGCKEVATTLPAVLVLFDRAFLAGSWAGVLRRWRAHLAVGFVPVAFLLWVTFGGLVSGASEATIGLGVKLWTPKTYALTQTEVIWHYFRLAVWPTGQVLDYLDWPVRASLAEVWPYAAGLAAVLAVVAYGVVRNRAWAVPAAAVFLILAPTSSIVPIQDVAFEHRMYLPLACLVALAAGLLAGPAARLPARPVAGAVAALVILLGFLTVVRNEDYSSNYRLYKDSAEKRPDNPRARGAYADILRQHGEFAEADAQIKAAVQLPRNTAANAVALGNVLFALGDADDAVRYIRGVHAQSPTDPVVSELLGLLLLATGKPAEAVAPLAVARAAKPSDPAVLFRLGSAQAGAGDEAAAAETFAALKAAAPGFAATLVTQARQTAMSDAAKPVHLRLAAIMAAAARRLDGPDDAAALDAAALAEARLGNYPAAADLARRAAASAERAGWPADKVSLLRERVGLFEAKKPYLPAELAAYRGSRP
ncbi:tetratricopeptide repeat protein [Urbifossiella limnaea]|uniref:Uncharacterized protein n=1 Tax=Urbifossiella limnaea TaxID=2528023 RepID=A0A517Y3K8_9BACT|nr:tetratricopeptide repeat protein [Urbifossiella limnaea]QDU24302.1 hypothetical protein ETAA1_63160 [Urbifossiella limnaea]